MKIPFALRAAAFLLPVALSAAAAAVMVTGCGNMLIGDRERAARLVLEGFTIVGADHYRGPAEVTFYNSPTAAARVETGTLKVRINAAGELEYEAWRKVPPGWIKSLTLTRERLTLLPGKETILIGRSYPPQASRAVRLQLDKDGVLSHQIGIFIPIHSVAEFQMIGVSPASLKAYYSGSGPRLRYELDGALDLMGGMAGVPDWEPLGSTINPLAADFIGKHNPIYNLKINKPGGSDVGLFGVVGSGAKINGVRVETGSVKGLNMVGSIAGQNNGTIESCFSKGVTVEGVNHVGGLVGVMTDSPVSGMSAVIKGSAYMPNLGGSVAVQGGAAVTANIGGIVGTITGSSAAGNSPLFSCWAEGRLYGGNVGGLAGLVDNGLFIRGCYFTGTPNGTNKSGGLAGINNGVIEDCVYNGGSWADVGVGSGGTVDLDPALSGNPTFSSPGSFPSVSGLRGWDPSPSGYWMPTTIPSGGGQYPMLVNQ